MIISMEAITEGIKLIPFSQLVKGYNVTVDLVLTNIFEFSPEKQIEYHEIMILADKEMSDFNKSMIHAILETLLTEWRPKLLASWGIIFESAYRPIWTLQVPTTQKNLSNALVLVVDLDHLHQYIFYPHKVCC